LFVHIAWIGFSSFYSTHPILSLKLLLAKSWYIGAFILLPLLVVQTKKAIRQTAQVFCFSMLTLTILALGRHAISGFTFASINEALAPFFRNHVNYSAMLVCTVPVWIVLYQLATQARHKKWIGAALLITFAALFFSYARGAWLALVVAGITVWLIRRRLILFAYIAAITVVAGAFVWLKTDGRYIDYAHDYKTTIFHSNFKEHLVATYRLKDVSTAERFYRWVAGVRMIGDRPLTGFGPNTFYYNYGTYTVSAFRTWVSSNTDHSTVHNYFLLLIIEQGWPGLMFFLLLLGAMLWYAQRIYHQNQDPFFKKAALAAGAVLSMIVTVNLLSDLIETDKVGSLFFLCLSMLIILDQTAKKSSPHIQGVAESVAE
jgi:O-antigen ligase